MTLATRTNDLTIPLPARPEAIAGARRKLRDNGLDRDLEHTVTLLVSELLTNSIRHSGAGPGDRIVLAARMRPDWVRIEVRDPGPGFDPGVRHETKGYGLRMLEMLAADWGVDRDDRGARVWFEVDRQTSRFGRH
jgi:anti-sigma regulatory factor (Ser/Thr protein kinase)